ncbi:hypothetical protein ACIQ4I_02545 [Rummeliibacillus sp. NPDC094406]|uniref:hypothetical protein n=1 Tax=Rummeliibacillus sp. NPDC094406 TaxID=3364511 RepID=UPI003809DB4B
MIWKQKKNCEHASYKFEADFTADPIWCKDCGENLDIDEFPLSDKLQQELWEWGAEYGKWIDLDTDSLKENGLKLEKNHNEKGLQLFQEVKKQLGEKYPIVFVPSKSAQLYNILKDN